MIRIEYVQSKVDKLLMDYIDSYVEEDEPLIDYTDEVTIDDIVLELAEYYEVYIDATDFNIATITKNELIGMIFAKISEQ